METTSATNNCNTDQDHMDQSGEYEDLEVEPASLPDLPALEEITKPMHSANNMITLEERQPNEPESNFFSLLQMALLKLPFPESVQTAEASRNSLTI